MGIFGIDAIGSANNNCFFVKNESKKADNKVLLFGNNKVQTPQVSFTSSPSCEASQTEPKQNKTYDANGNLIKEDFGAFAVEYEYDENGKKTKEIYQNVESPFGPVKQTFLFDENGKECKYIYEYGEGSEKITKENEVVPEYDENGNLTKRILKNKDGEVVSTHIFDKDGKLTEIKFEKGGEEKFKYDENGLLTQKVHTSKSGLFQYDYTYNDKNQLIQTKDLHIIKNVRDIYTGKYQYDDDGKLKNIKEYNKGLLCAVHITYDENGKVLQKKYTDFRGVPERFLKYKDGELVEEKLMFDDGSPFETIKY